jgi:hypothetical protein
VTCKLLRSFFQSGLSMTSTVFFLTRVSCCNLRH